MKKLLCLFLFAVAGCSGQQASTNPAIPATVSVPMGQKQCHPKNPYLTDSKLIQGGQNVVVTIKLKDGRYFQKAVVSNQLQDSDVQAWTDAGHKMTIPTGKSKNIPTQGSQYLYVQQVDNEVESGGVQVTATSCLSN